ncbi:MAG TPA: FKBP-type peptidyl-prolyl cis-trans isomerase [Verrucomicrobiae bacterium]|nr:FKBP-type peptidyl-prolyl cis-trans isomerase [Verrucomicrobiae bacterium]
MRILLTALLFAALAAGAQQRSTAAEATPAAQEKPAFKDDREKASYAVGIFVGNQIKRSNMDVDLNILLGAVQDVLGGKDLRLTDMQASEAIRTYQAEARRKLAEKNKKEGEAFLTENKNKPGVQTKSVSLPDGSSAEMQYKVITEGTGEIPKSNDTVSVNYRGTLLNGKEFDSSYKRGQPAKFMVNRVVKGWTAALESMKVGSKWELYIPSGLAYGDMGNANIEPGATLIFEVELLGIEPPPPATPPAQPLTSDIIKVPSAEELKKGAKIEVIKAEDAAKQAQQATPTNNDKTEKK